WQRSHILGGGRDIADEQNERSAQAALGMPAQHFLHGGEPGGLVSMQQGRHEQRLRVAAGKVEQRRSRQDVFQAVGGTLEKSVRQPVEQGARRVGHFTPHISH
ncbi:MAG: hypothetical protein AB7U61_17805, partial [Methylocystis sp.]